MKRMILLSMIALGAAGFAGAVGTVDNEDPTSADRALDHVLGSGNKPAVQTSSGAAAGAENVDRPDSWITGKVKTALTFHKSVSGLKTEVDTSGGVVTLKGEAENQAQKDLSTEYASQVEGVKAVNNLMTVKGERTMDAAVDDATITAQIKSALLTRRSTSALNTTVKSYNGVVTLGGVAKSDAEKELAEMLARGVKGVHEVNNVMIVQP
jgi:hyperosmotically inducible protein